MTKGILDPHDYYYRRVYTDAVLAVEMVRRPPDGAMPERVAVTGGSQGGGITLAVSSLVPDLWAVMPDVPFLCDFPRATQIVGKGPIRGDCPVFEHSPRPRRASLLHPGLLRRRHAGSAGHCTGAVLCGPHGPDLPAVDRIRRLQLATAGLRRSWSTPSTTMKGARSSTKPKQLRWLAKLGKD